MVGMSLACQPPLTARVAMPTGLGRGAGWQRDGDTCFSSLMDWIRSMRISFSRSSSPPGTSSSGSTPSSSGPLPLLARALGLLFYDREVAGVAGPSGRVGLASWQWGGSTAWGEEVSSDVDPVGTEWLLLG